MGLFVFELIACHCVLITLMNQFVLSHFKENSGLGWEESGHKHSSKTLMEHSELCPIASGFESTFYNGNSDILPATKNSISIS